MKKLIKIIGSIFCLLAQNLIAQSSRDTINYDIYSVSGYRPKVAEGVKINENPVIQDTTKRIPVLNYSITTKQMEVPFKLEPIVPARMVNEPVSKLYKTLVKAGIGNYATAYGEVFFNSLRSKELAYGAHLKHLSSNATLKDVGYSGYSDNEFNLYGKKFFKEHILYGDFDYSRNVVHNYGYDVKLNKLEKNITKQRYTLISPRLQLKSFLGDSAPVNYDLLLKYYNFAERFESSENNILAQGLFSGYINKEKIVVLGGVDYYNYKTGLDTINNTIINLNPSIVSVGEKFKANIGLGTAIDIDTNTNFYFYPRIEASYNIVDNIIIPYAGLSGGLQKNSYRSLAEENPFILSSISTVNSNNRLELYGGLKGSLSSATSYSSKVSYSKVDNMYFFVNDYTESLENRFNVIYDDVKFLNVHGELAYQKTEKLRFLVKGDYYKYTTTKEARAWHKPEMEMNLSTIYNLKDKIIIRGDVFYIGKQFARVLADPFACPAGDCFPYESKQLNGFTDINLGVEYRYNKTLSAFVNFNNIGSVRYYRWNNYPLQRFNILGGVTYAF